MCIRDRVKGKNQTTFKKQVKNKVWEAAFQYLLDKASSHSKMENLNYEKYEMQSYLKNEKVTKIEAQTYFKFRTRMEDFANNFRNGFTDIDCGLCLWKESSQCKDS